MTLQRTLTRALAITGLAAIGPILACSGSGDVDTSGADGGSTKPTNSSTSTSTTSMPTTTSTPTTTTTTTTPPAGTDAGISTSGDGTPTRQACTSNFGAALDTSFGRLDGYLVAIVPPGTKGCNGDDDHVHLQISMSGGIYDVAIDIDSPQDADPNVSIDQVSQSLYGGPWAEGWHTNASFGLDYVDTLDLHSTSFTETAPAALATQVESLLANVNHMSVFATGYGPTGIHDVHFESKDHDGAIVFEPLSASPQYLVFHFSEQTF